MTEIAATSGTPSTPDTGITAPVVAEPSAEPQAPSSPTPVAAAPVVPVEGAPAEPVAPVVEATVDPNAPLFALPDDFTLRPEAKSKFEAFVKGKLKDGTLQAKPQEVVDAFIEQARDSYAAWQTQVAAQDQAWQTESQGRFTKTQLAAAETGVGFLSSFEPAFRELVKGFSNHPSFVNAMRVIGERLSEDAFEIEGSRPVVNGKAAKDVLYPPRN